MYRNYAPTAQVASQQGKYLARVFNQLAKKEELELALEEARHASGSQPIDMEYVPSPSPCLDSVRQR